MSMSLFVCFPSFVAKDVDFYELNEAFAVVAVANMMVTLVLVAIVGIRVNCLQRTSDTAFTSLTRRSHIVWELKQQAIEHPLS